MNVQSIKETLVAPIVATIISIGLVTDWSSAETSDSAGVTEDSMTNASRSMRTDSHLKKMGYSRTGSGGAMLIRLVYRLPLHTRRHDQYTHAIFLQRTPFAVDSPAFVTIQYQQVMSAGSPTRIWWM